MTTQPQQTKRRGVMVTVSPVIGAGLTLAGWVVMANVGWQLMTGLAQTLLCEVRSRRSLECLPAWSQMRETGRRSTETLLALVVHSPAESAAAAMGGLAGSLLNRRRAGNRNEQLLCGPIGIVPSPGRHHDENGDDLEPA